MESATETTRSWAEEVLDQMTAHVQAEEGVLEQYARTAQQAEEPDVRSLIMLLCEDDVRHHRIFEEMAHALEGTLQWRRVGPSVPDRGRGPLPPELVELTHRLHAIERDDKRQLRALRRRLGPVADTTLWPLLVDLMELDTDKHLRILDFIAARAKG